MSAAPHACCGSRCTFCPWRRMPDRDTQPDSKWCEECCATVYLDADGRCPEQHTEDR